MLTSFFYRLGLVATALWLFSVGQAGGQEKGAAPPVMPEPAVTAVVLPPVVVAEGEAPVATPTPLQALLSSFASQRSSSKELVVYPCKHLSAGAMATLLEDFLTPSGTVAECRESDTVVVMDEAAQIPAIRQIMEQLDQPSPQVMVEARVVEFTMDADYEREVNVEFQSFKNLNQIEGLPDDSASFVKRMTDSFVTPGGNVRNTQGSASWMHYDPEHQNLLSVFLTFLETRGRARILSAPNLVLRRGTEGNIITGQEVPIPTQTVTSGSVSTSTIFKSVGIKLRVQPTMVSGNKVRMRVSPEVSNVIGYDKTSGAPIIAVRSANTELDVLDGQMVSIGGLLRSEERDFERRVPFLGNIPILGLLFRGTEKQTVRSQLVIFLNIKIVSNAELGTLVPSPKVYEEMTETVRAMEKKLDLPPLSLERDIDLLQDKPLGEDPPPANPSTTTP